MPNVARPKIETFAFGPADSFDSTEMFSSPKGELSGDQCLFNKIDDALSNVACDINEGHRVLGDGTNDVVMGSKNAHKKRSLETALEKSKKGGLLKLTPIDGPKEPKREEQKLEF